MARRKRGSVPSYRLHKSTGQAVVTFNGTDHYLGRYDTPRSKAEYARMLAEFMSTGRITELSEAPTEIVVTQVLADYWKHAKGYYVKNGEPTNELHALKLIIRDTKALYGHTPAEQFGPLALKAVRQVWIDRGQARTSINKNMRRLTRIFRWAVAEELVSGGVLHALQAVPGLKKGRCSVREPEPIQSVAMKTVEQTIPFLPKVTQDMVRFQLLTGARPGEVCKMTPSMLDRSSDVWEYRVDGHKTEHHGRTRTIYIGPEAQAVLSPYLLRAPDAVCFSMAESLKQRRQLQHDARTTPLHCGNRPGKRSGSKGPGQGRTRKPQESFDTGTYRRAIHYACDVAFPAPEPLAQQERESNAARLRRLTESQRAELEAWQKSNRWHPNQLRHTRGTEIRKRFGLEAAQVILGHAAADVTQVYAERDADKAREVARQVG